MIRPATSPNPRRVAAGRRNWSKRRGFTPEGLARLRQSALEHQPWTHATGPRTIEGKARSAANGRVYQQGPLSIRQIRAELAGVRALIDQLRDGRKQVGGVIGEQ